MRKIKVHSFLDDGASPLIKLLFEMYDLQVVMTSLDDAELVIVGSQDTLIMSLLATRKMILVLENKKGLTELSLPDDQVFVYRAWQDELGIVALPFWLGMHLPK